MISAGNVTSASGHGSDVDAVLITRTVIYCVIWPIIILPGIFGNVLSLIVIRKTEGSNSTSEFLISLAMADTLNLVVKGVQMVFTWGEMFWPHQYLTWKLSTLSFVVLSYIPDRISRGITVAIVGDRAIALTAPLRYKIICRPMRIKTIIVVLFVVIVLTSLPTIVDVFMFHFTPLKNRTIHTNIGKLYRSHISQSELKPIHLMAIFLLFDCMPIPIVFVGNIIIILSLRKSNIVAPTTSEVQQQRKLQERQLTKLLLTISMLFFFLTAPLALYRLIFVALTISQDTNILLLDTNHTLSLSNSAINFVVYAVMNKKYKAEYVEILRRCRRSNAIEDSHRN